MLMSLEQALPANHPERVPFLKRIQQAHPDDFWINARLGQVMSDLGKYGEALGYLQAALAVRPRTSVVRSRLGQLLAAMGRRDEALDQYRQAVRLDPTAASPRWLLAGFPALRHRNFRLFIVGQGISLIGFWMQSVAQGWLVYRLSGSALALGVVAFAAYVPILCLAPVAVSSWRAFLPLPRDRSLSVLRADHARWPVSRLP